MNNTQLDTTKIQKPQPKYRRKLNQEQIAVLRLLCQVRFASNEQIAKYQAKPDSKAIQKRLKILEDQGFIAKRYDKSYKLQGKPAAYYLTPHGARTLESNEPSNTDTPLNIKRLYKDKDASEGFITHCKNILDVYQALKVLYPLPDQLGYYTKSQLSYEKYDYMPNPLPSALIRVKANEGDRYYFLDIFENDQPFFVLIRRIKKYLDYAGGGEWSGDDDELPTVLLVAQNKSVHRRLRKRLFKELRDSYEEVHFATTRLEHILNPVYNGNVWFPIDEYEDEEEPVIPVALTELPQADN